LTCSTGLSRPGARMYLEDHGILVVDDDPARRRRVAQILADENFPVITAAEGLAALRAMSGRRYALIIAALRLPGSLDGTATARQARLRQPGLKALLVGDYGHRPVATGDDDEFITAPIERWQLLGCVFELLQRQPGAAAADLARRARTERHAS